MSEVPELWWNPEYGVLLRVGVVDGVDYGWNVLGARMMYVDELPADAVPLVPAEPVDEKSRGEAYMRGHRDGRLAERAGIGREETLLPPFAPELVDAPLVTGESGAPAPLVVDQPVHDSTLPAELEQPTCRTCGHVRGVHHKLRCEHPGCDECNGWRP